MDSANEEGYKPPPEFQEVAKEPLFELSLTDSTELWLIQWPINQPPDFDGQEFSLDLHQDGQLGCFEGSSGKLYDVVSFTSQEPDATVFLSSASDSKIVGKISRRVSLVHYPEPNELEKLNSNKLRQMYQRSSGTSLTNSSHHFATPSQGTMLRSSQSGRGHAASTRSSRHRSSSSGSAKNKSSLSEVGEPSKPSKRRHVHVPIGSMGQSTQDSERGHSTVTSSGSLEHSHQGKSKKKKRNEE